MKNMLIGLVAVTALGFNVGANAQSAKVGKVDISNAYTRATAPGQQVAAGYMKIDNTGGAADQLIGVSSPAAGEVQLHEMSMEGNVMKMRQIKDISVPAGGIVELKPGGFHLMFVSLKGAFTAGETIPVKLKFAKAGEVEFKIPVNAMGGIGHSGGQHGGMMKQ